MLSIAAAAIKLSLTARAIEGRPTALNDAVHGAVAAGRHARGAFAVVDPENVLKITEFAIGLPIVFQR